LKETKGEIKKQEKQKREDWNEHRSWSWITSGVLLVVLGVVEYLTSKTIFKIVPHFTTKEFKQFLYQVTAAFKGKKIVMILDNCKIHKAKILDPLLEKWEGKFELYFLPPHAGHLLNPIEGFWHALKDAIGAGRSFDHIQELYLRTKQVLSRHQKDPIYHYSWAN